SRSSIQNPTRHQILPRALPAVIRQRYAMETHASRSGVRRHVARVNPFMRRRDLLTQQSPRVIKLRIHKVHSALQTVIPRAQLFEFFNAARTADGLTDFVGQPEDAAAEEEGEEVHHSRYPAVYEGPVGQKVSSVTTMIGGAISSMKMTPSVMFRLLSLYSSFGSCLSPKPTHFPYSVLVSQAVSANNTTGTKT